VVAISIMVFTATASVLAGLHSAPSAFSLTDTYSVVSSSAPTIFSSQLDVQMVDVLDSAPNVTGTSPEVFAFSTWNGHSIVLRGADISRLNSTGPEFEKFETFGSQGLEERGSALAGTRLLSRLGVELPFVMPVVGSYSPKMDFVNIVGMFETGTALDDEMIVSLDMARFLSGMPSNKVSTIRVSTSDPGWLSEALSPTEARFALLDLSSSKSVAVAGETVEVSVSAMNWGSSDGEVVVTFLEDGVVASSQTVALLAGESKELVHTFASDVLGAHTVEASIGGDFPTRIEVNITVSDPFLNLAAPSHVALDQSFSVTVSDHTGRLVGSAAVSFGSSTTTTDSNGNATFDATALGSYQVRAELSGYRSASRSVEVFDPSAFPNEFGPSVTSFTLSPDIMKQNESASGVLMVENNGTISGTAIIEVQVDSSVEMLLAVPLLGLESKTIRFALEDLEVGTHIVQVGAFSEELVVQSWIVENPDLVQLVLRYGGVSDLVPSGTIPIYQAAKISEGNISVALFALGAVSALLATLAIVSVFSKEIHEGRRRLGIMKTLGASRSAIRRLVFPPAFGLSLAGAVLGMAVGIAIALWLSGSGEVMLFGHELEIRLNLPLLALILVAAVAISLASALATAMLAAGETAIATIRKLPQEEPAPLDAQSLLGDD